MAVTSLLPMAMNTKDEQFFRELGARIALRRKEQDLTQQQLAERLGVAQQTLAHYEVGRLRVPTSLLPTLAHELDASLDELLGLTPTKQVGKRGPASRLQQQVDAISQLPRTKQRFVLEMLEAVLAQQHP